MTNDKWVKLFITPETQTLLMFTLDNGRHLVELSVMKKGVMYTEEVYGESESDESIAEAQEVFDNFTREDANEWASTVSHKTVKPAKKGKVKPAKKTED